ncbi:MAG: AAA family ATPase [Candidatus Bathyarchaeia archaeon]
MERTDEFVDEWGLERKALTILKCVGNLRMIGETGTGKTHFIHHLCEKHGLKLWEFSLSSDTERWDLLASDVLKEATTQTREGVILLWLQDPEGGVCFLDEFNYAQPNVTTLINQLSDFRRSVWVPELQQRFYRSGRHYLAIAMNPYEKIGYSGTFQTNIAQMRRFESLVFDFLSPKSETELLLKVYDDYEWVRRLVEFVNKIRILYRRGELTTPITTGNLRNYCAFVREGLDEREIVEIASSLFLEEERPVIRRLWEEGETRYVKG